MAEANQKILAAVKPVELNKKGTDGKKNDLYVVTNPNPVPKTGSSQV